jgi:biotin synthase
MKCSKSPCFIQWAGFRSPNQPTDSADEANFISFAGRFSIVSLLIHFLRKGGVMNWDALADKILDGGAATREEALAVLNSPDDELLAVLQSAFQVRRKFFGKKVSLHVLKNARSGACPEDCAFCSQSKTAESGVEQYGMQSADEMVAGAREAEAMQALRYCVVTSSRAPADQDLDVICEAAQKIKAGNPQLELCASMGFLTEEKARRLKAAGVDRFNHNLETSERFDPSICSRCRSIPPIPCSPTAI